ncbi:hypothetical protein PRIPAC_95562 [Pristionchus pacificus]|uniref:Uncharacterized protein n=1 Tax=Pristionchus pacificus TaxID=54126 RepID=A0A2A6B3F0_PRIPA|nr:hypothetical protein PRIPAC_95562 [Pristionchus pacificus]|eukprot:PDM60415.1 hypothetical protein PRIPAC_54240 [Pristionchus pacificus]
MTTATPRIVSKLHLEAYFTARIVDSDLQRTMPVPDFMKKHKAYVFKRLSPDGFCEGRNTKALYLAMSSEVKGASGGYYTDCARAKESKDALDDEACKRLYD